MKYQFWYKREFEAKYLHQAMRMEKRKELKLHSIKTVEEGEEKTPLIGFTVEQIDEE